MFTMYRFSWGKWDASPGLGQNIKPVLIKRHFVILSVQAWFRCGRGVLPWCFASYTQGMTSASATAHGSLWPDFLFLRHLCSDRPFSSPFHGLILWADSFEYVLSFNFAVQPKKFVVKVSPDVMDNYACPPFCMHLVSRAWDPRP